MNYEQKDAELFWHVEQLKSGNAQSYNRVYELSQKYIYKIINDIVKDHHATEDLMQETYLQIYNKIGSLQEAKAFYVWAGRIATNLTLRHIQKYRKEVLVTEDEEGGTDFVFDTAAADNECFIPENILMDQEKQRLLGEILDNLSVDQKLSVQYFYYEEMSVRDIAQAMEYSEGTVKSRLNYARKAIKDAVLNLEVKQGTRLYSLSAMPLFLILFRQGAEQAAVAAGVGAATTGAAAMGAGQAVGNMVPGGPAQMVGNMVNAGPGQMVGNMVSGGPGQMVGNMVNAGPGQMVGNMVNGTPGQMVGNMVSGTPNQMVGNMVNGTPGQMIGNMTAGPGNVGMPPYGAESMGAVPTGAGVTATGAVGATGAGTAATVAGMATWVKVLIIIIVVAVVGGGGYGVYKATQDKNPPTEQASGGMPAAPFVDGDEPQAGTDTGEAPEAEPEEPAEIAPEVQPEERDLKVYSTVYYTEDGRVFYQQYEDGINYYESVIPFVDTADTVAENPDIYTLNYLSENQSMHLNAIYADSTILSEASMQELISYGLQILESKGKVVLYPVDQEFILEYNGQNYRYSVYEITVSVFDRTQEHMEYIGNISSPAEECNIYLHGTISPADGIEDIWPGTDSNAQGGGNTSDVDANIDFPDINLPVVTPARMMEIMQDTLYIDFCLSNMTDDVFYSLMDQVPCTVTLQDGSVYEITLAEFIFKDWSGYADLDTIDYDDEYARELSLGYVTTDSLLP